MLRPEFAFENTGYYAMFRIIVTYVPIFHVVFGSCLGEVCYDSLEPRGSVPLQPKF